MNNLPRRLMSRAAIRHVQETRVVVHAILIGSIWVPYLSVTGSLATILWLIALRVKRLRSLLEFFKIAHHRHAGCANRSLLVLWN